MLTGIKEMINQKTDFMEAADLLYEEAAGNLDDLIVLGEEAEEDAAEDEGLPGPDSIEEGDESEVEAEEDEKEGPGDFMNAKIKDDSSSNLEDDIPEEEPLPLPGDNSQRFDPMNSEIEDDILSTNIDLRSNTSRDTLPIPPAGAGDAIEGNDDLLTQRVDSGFSGGSDSMNMNTEIPEEGDSMGAEIPENESDDQFSEAITVAGDDEGDAGTDDTGADTSTDEGSDSTENDVTSAVRDKVAESDDAPDEGMGDDFGGDFGGASSDREASIMKKLSKLTKDIEDAKTAVVDIISNK